MGGIEFLSPGAAARGVHATTTGVSTLRAPSAAVLAGRMALAIAVLLSPSGAGAAEPVPDYDDPFAYCAAVVDADAPAPPYHGAALPPAVLAGVAGSVGLGADAPPAFRENATWRCMDGRVWACHYGANLPCDEQARVSREPTPAMNAYCRERGADDDMPAYATGRATVHAWRCVAGEAVAGRQLLHADRRGFLSEFWFEIPAP